MRFLIIFFSFVGLNLYSQQFINITEPLPNSSLWNRDNITIRWDGPSDALYAVFVSFNKGYSWDMIADSVKGNSVEWNVLNVDKNVENGVAIKVVRLGDDGGRIKSGHVVGCIANSSSCINFTSGSDFRIYSTYNPGIIISGYILNDKINIDDAWNAGPFSIPTNDGGTTKNTAVIIVTGIRKVTQKMTHIKNLWIIGLINLT